MNTEEKKYLIGDYVRTQYMVPKTELTFDIFVLLYKFLGSKELSGRAFASFEQIAQ